MAKTVKFTRSIATGDYHCHFNGNYFFIERGKYGYNINILEVRHSPSGDWDTFVYLTTCRTLKECRETIETYHE